MDLITLAMAKAYSDSKGGYVEKPVLTFNGDITGKTLETFGLSKYVKISDKPHDLTKVERLVFSFDPEIAEAGGMPTEVEVPKGAYTVEGNADDSIISSDGNALILSFGKKQEGSVFDVGVYVIVTILDGKVAQWVSRLEFAETIHTIDPKFIPGAVLPVVEITGEFNADGTLYCSETESAALTAVAALGMPAVVKIPALGGLSAVFAFADEGFLFTMGSTMMYCSNSGDGWIVFGQQG